MISVIVPIYNKDKYIKRCIDSIKKQSFNDFECILVDDGSTDNSANIVLKSIQNDSRFKYIYQKNMGVSSARNTGIKASIGEWICFIDADDFIELDYLEDFMRELNKHNCDVIFSTNENIKENVVIIQELISNFNSWYKYEIFNPPWGKIYKKALIKTYFHHDLSIGEDLLFNINYLLDNQDKKIAFMTSNKYKYSNIEDSLSNTVSKKIITQSIQLIYLISKLSQIQTSEILTIQSNSLSNKILSFYEITKSFDWFLSNPNKEQFKSILSNCSLRLKIMLILWFKQRYTFLKIYFIFLKYLKGY